MTQLTVLSKQRGGLRIRQFADHAEQTLKVPNESTQRDLEEITDPLSLVEAQKLIEQGELKSGQVTQALAARGLIRQRLLLKPKPRQPEDLPICRLVC